MGAELPIAVSVQCLGVKSSSILSSLVVALEEETVEVLQYCNGNVVGEADRCSGVTVLFDEVSKELTDLVRAKSCDGLHRVLAIAMSSEALAGGKAWTPLQAGAADIVEFRSVPHAAAIIAARFKRWREVDRLVDSPVVTQTLVGRSRAWILVLRRLVEIAGFTNCSALLTGETGTGKELAANLIHSMDRREGKGKLVVLDCTTIVPELSGSEFYGHERGAFTSAVASREGAFSLADGGTLFLDEVGELPLTLQAALLRVIQERLYKPVGSNNWKRAQFRLVCATNRDLLEEESRGNMRSDFYFRVAAASCRLPSLHERREDIIPLVEHFLRESDFTGPVNEFEPAVRDFFMVRNYRGNVRELRQLVLRMVGRHVGSGPLSLGDIPEDERPVVAEMFQGDWRRHIKDGIRHALARGITLRDIGSGASQTAIETVVDEEHGNLKRAARRLGVTDRALQMRRAADRAEEQRVEAVSEETMQTDQSGTGGP
jgi:transcriptional regulator with GAF, ATPase, and Fis domain